MKKLLTICFLGMVLSGWGQFGEAVIVASPGEYYNFNESNFTNVIGSDTLEYWGHDVYKFDSSGQKGILNLPYDPLMVSNISNYDGKCNLNNDGFMDFLYVTDQLVYYDSTGFVDYNLIIHPIEVDGVNNSLIELITDTVFLDSFIGLVYPSISSVTSLDLDSDDDDDLIVTIDNYADDGNTYITIFQNDGNGQFDFIFMDTTCYYCINYLIGDLDGNGFNDLYTTSGATSELSAFISQSSAMTFEFADNWNYLDEFYNAMDLTNNTYAQILDVNSDGLNDIVTMSNEFVDSSYVFYNQGNFIFDFDVSLIHIDNPYLFDHTQDFDSDGDIDSLISIYYYPSQGYNLIFYRNDLSNYTPFLLSDNTSFQFATIDYDLDGDLDLFYPVYTEGVYMRENTGIIMSNPAGFFQANVFTDFNNNGIQDVNENNAYTTLSVDSTSYYYSTSPNQILVAQSGEHEFGIQIDPDLWSFNNITDTIVSLDTLQLSFPLVPIGDSTIMNLWFYQNWWTPCGDTTTAYISYSNWGNSFIDTGPLTLELDTLYEFVNASIAPTTISQNIYTWTITNFGVYDYENIQLTLIRPSSDYLGDTITNIISFLADDGYSIANVDSQIHQCSYDPNDITEHNGHTDAGYILTGDELEYTIRFQNTGNAPAQNVRIENQLSEKLDWSSIQPVAWSHDFNLMIDENGLATFTFDNIMLPDSVNDEANSHGFVRYRITSDADLVAGEIIENTAEIFFDFNPAVVTNTEVNTIYECSDLEQGMASATEVCAGESISFSNDAIWIENLTWSFDDIEVGEGNYTQMLNESGVMTMNVGNSLCSYTQSWNLVANIAIASFTSTGNMLTANAATSYQWYLNGNAIANATAQTFEIAQTGNYNVMITDENGCGATSDAMMVTYIGVNEKTKNSISVYPNPIAEISTVQVPENLLGKYFHVYTTSGELVLIGKLNGRSHPINCEDLAPGVYILRIENERVMLVKG